MIKETITVKDSREMKKAVKKKYDTIILEGAVKDELKEKLKRFQFDKKGKEISGLACSVGLAGTVIFGMGIPVLIGGLIGSVVFKDAIKHYELNYDEETGVLKLLYYKG